MRDLNSSNITQAVLNSFDNTPDSRTRKVLQVLVRHLHAFVREVRPSDAEWLAGIGFLTRTGKLCDDSRQEFILLSDTLGVTMLVDVLNHANAGATENSVLGPFFVERRPTAESGADIAGGIIGTPLLFAGRVLDDGGRPIAGALVDVWHSDGDGFYDVARHGTAEPAMRAALRSDADGGFWFRSIVPSSYPIPTDGTVGEMLNAARRSPMRPAHVHVMIDAPGYERLTSMIFIDGDPYLDADPVFGVKQSLIGRFEEVGDNVGGVRYSGDFRLARLRSSAAEAA